MIASGDDLGETIVTALEDSGLVLEPGDVLVLAQKIVSKAEGRRVDLGTVMPSSRAVALGEQTGKDPGSSS